MIKLLHTTTLFFTLLLCCQILHAQQDATQALKLPPISKWLEKQDGTPANWLGRKYQKKELWEPINVVIVDPFAKSREEAIAKLQNACKQFGYKPKIGHSSGYCAVIDSLRNTPFNGKKALANRSFYRTNNHGRIMGPEYFDGKYIFAGAFSRESFQLFTKAHHAFRSFLEARNDFCHKLNKSSAYSILGLHYMDNHIDTHFLTTGDHDGEAIVLCANH